MPYYNVSMAHDASFSTDRVDRMPPLNELGTLLPYLLLQDCDTPGVSTPSFGPQLAPTSELHAMDTFTPQLDEDWASSLHYTDKSMDINNRLMLPFNEPLDVPEIIPSLTVLHSMRDAAYDTKEPSTIDPALLSMPCGKTVPLAPPTTTFPSLVTPASISPPLDVPFPSKHAMGTLHMTNRVHANTYDRERAINSDEGFIPFPDPSPAARYRPPTTNLPSRARKSKTAEVTRRYECQSRNKNAEIPDELIVLALQDPSRGCPVNECAYVPTAIGKRGSGQASDLLRHIESHRPKQWVCCGLPLNVAIEKGLRQEGDLPNFYYRGQPMVGGCVHYLSRKDSLARHLEGKGRDCLTDISIVENHIKERRANFIELSRQYVK